MDASLTLITLPAGLVFDYAGSTVPDGWLACNGQAVSRTTYANLFAAIGTTYGIGNGSTTFNVPDTRGRATIGVGQGSGLTNRVLGATTGAETHTLSESEMPSHTHTQNSHTHTYATSSSGTGTGSNYTRWNMDDEVAGLGTGGINYNSIPSATATNQNTGGGQAHNNMQPSLAMNRIIKF